MVKSNLKGTKGTTSKAKLAPEIDQNHMPDANQKQNDLLCNSSYPRSRV